MLLLLKESFFDSDINFDFEIGLVLLGLAGLGALLFNPEELLVD
jgi:hypothetical protein